ncbi:hypothetical protein EDB19DRAFT_1316466 [Suillus lakei]|nr:hypothetical protein EDB19DRAFT_1316466 [Suillus lakei]
MSLTLLLGMTSYISIYRTYFCPNATGDVIVRVSHYFICFWAVWMGCWATIVSVIHPTVSSIGSNSTAEHW